jgi:AraC-like DNA-binding protein
MHKSNTDIPHIKQSLQTEFKLMSLSAIDTRKQAHRHDFYVLVYVKDGSGVQYLDYEEIPIVPGRVHFIAPQKVHLWQGKCNGYVMVISASYIQNIAKVLDDLFMHFDNNVYLDIPKKEQEQFDALMEIVANRYYAQGTSPALLQSLVQTFLYYCSDLKQRQQTRKQKPQDERLLKIKQLIEKHYKDEYSTSMYAHKLSLTPQHLNRLLKQYTGKTIGKLVKERKILEAKRELVFTNKSIDAIGESLGFFDSSNFSKYFKKHTSLSPSVFRKMFKKYQ